MKSDFKKQLWIGASIILCSIIIAALALFFLSGDLSRQATTIVTKKSDADSQAQAASNLANLEQSAPKAEKFTAAMNTVWSSEDQLIGFSEWLQKKGVSSDVSVQIANTGNLAHARSDMPGNAHYSFTAQGSLQDIVAFLDNLESHEGGYLISVDSFNVSYAVPTYTLSGQLTVFFHP